MVLMPPFDYSGPVDRHASRSNLAIGFPLLHRHSVCPPHLSQIGTASLRKSWRRWRRTRWCQIFAVMLFTLCDRWRRVDRVHHPAPPRSFAMR